MVKYYIFFKEKFIYYVIIKDMLNALVKNHIGLKIPFG